MQIRLLEPMDIPELVVMLNEYMRETYHSEWNGSEESLARDVIGRRLSVLVAERSDRLVGFIAWMDSYDLHWSMPGAVIADLFVRRGWRGLAVGVQLVCSAVARVESHGGKFIKGGAVDNIGVRRLYERSAVRSESIDFTLSGRAFRQTASLEGASGRVLAASMPEKQWNYEE